MSDLLMIGHDKPSAPVSAELPPALKPWRVWLGWFDAELAIHLGNLLLRLSELVGPAPAVASHAALEPDGLDDLRARGSYERLLSSEWLLADELPEEFLRRAVSSEHLFLAPRLRSARVERSVVAIFDCGPLQLGAARLAHIAAWILLARRAAQSDGLLRWGVLQAPGVLHAADAVENLNTLLTARQLTAGGETQLAAWRAAISDISGEVETWWIGAGLATDAVPAGRRERVLALRPGLDPKVLDVLLTAGTNARRAQLVLPPERAGTTLLRGQFRSVPKPVTTSTIRNSKIQRFSLVKPPLLSVPSGFVGVSTLEGHAMQVFSLPRSGQAKQATPRLQQWSPTRPPLAAMLAGRQTGALCSDGTSLHFWQIEGFGVRPRPDAKQFEATIATGNWLQMIRLVNGTAQRVCVIDRKDRILAWDGVHRKQGRARTEAKQLLLPTGFDKQVLSMVQMDSAHLIYAVNHEGGLWLRSLEVLGTPSARSRRLCAVPEFKPRVYMATAVVEGNRRRLTVDAVAVCAGLPIQSWQLISSAQADAGLEAAGVTREHEIALAPGERAFGLVSRLDAEMPGLIVRSTDRHVIHAVTPAGRVVLHHSAQKIEQCTVCPHSGLVALLTAHRDLIVLDARLNTIVFAMRDADIVSAAEAIDE